MVADTTCCRLRRDTITGSPARRLQPESPGHRRCCRRPQPRPRTVTGAWRPLISDRGDTRRSPLSCDAVRCLGSVDSVTDLVRHYADPSLAGLSPAELEAADRAFYAAHRRPHPPRIVGVDVASNAVGYSRRVGLLERGWTENLETRPPSAQLTAALADVGLITATGGVGYITERTFDTLLRETPAPRPPWVAAFVLRIFPYDRIAATLRRHGLLTEELPGVTFPQRRFASTHERDSALDAVRARGLDPAGKEDRGQFHARFYLSRPASDVEAEPLPRLLNGLAVEAGSAEADAAGPRER